MSGSLSLNASSQVQVELSGHVADGVNGSWLAAGHFKLASLVQYVPLSTVGGYLGYVSPPCFRPFTLHTPSPQISLVGDAVETIAREP